MKVKHYPECHIEADNGVGRVVKEYCSRLQQLYGVEFVNKDKDADIIVSHAGTYAKPDVLHLHGLYWTADYEASNMEFHANAAIAEAMRHAYRITVPSQWVAETIKREFRFSPDVVPHGIDWQDWQHDLPTQDYALYNKNRDGVDVCDSRHLIELAQRLPTEDFVATVCKEPIDNVFIMGVVSHAQMKPVVQAANIYLSLVKETFGIGILEALASGVPVLGFRHGGNVDLIKHKETGYLAEVGNYEDLADGYLWLKEHRHEMTEACKLSAMAYSWDNTVNQVYQIYQEALKEKRRKPTYSVIIPCYNYAHYLPTAVKSALAQNNSYFDNVVIVNDGSTDNTREVALDLVDSDARVIYIEQENAGVANARNTGIKAVRSKYITCLDADDTLEPNFAKTLINELEKDRTLGVAYSKLYVFGDGVKRHISNWPVGYDYDAFLRKQNQVPTMCVFRRDIWERLGGYRQRYAPRGAGAEDAEFWFRFGNLGYAGKLVNRPLVNYRLGGNTSAKGYIEANWLSWHPFTRNGKHNFLSVAKADKGSHAVTQHDEPVVSVIIPVGKGHKRFVVDAIDSVEAQTFNKWEIILVWDSPNKPDKYLLKQYPYIHFVDNSKSKHHGAGVARNLGAKIARGKYLLFLDADDYLQSGFIEATLNVLNENDDVRWVYTDFAKIANERELAWDVCDDFNVELLHARSIAPVTFLMYKADFAAAGMFEEIHNREDWDLQLRLAQKGFCGMRLPLPLFTYRIDSGFRREYIGVAKSEDERKKLHDEDIQRIHNTFNLKELKMACSNCKKQIQVAVPGTASTLIYIGGRYKTDVTWRGAVTHKTYRTDRGVLYNVHPDDAKAFVSGGLFAYKELPAMSPPLTTTEPKEVKAKPPVDRATRIAQINEKLMAIRKEAEQETVKDFTPPQPIEQDAWWQTPEDYSLTQIKKLVASKKPTTQQLIEMKENEVMGKGRTTVISYLESKV